MLVDGMICCASARRLKKVSMLDALPGVPGRMCKSGLVMFQMLLHIPQH